MIFKLNNTSKLATSKQTVINHSGSFRTNYISVLCKSYAVLDFFSPFNWRLFYAICWLMFTRVLRLLIPALCTLTVLHYWWSLGSLSCCGYWSYWDVWWGTCSKCVSCSQFLGVFTEEELAKCTCTLYQEHHGKTPASLLGTWAVHVLSVVLWTVNKSALIC